MAASPDIAEQLRTGHLSHGLMAVIGIVGVFALIGAFKVVKFILKFALFLLGLAAIAAAVWWFLLRT